MCRCDPSKRTPWCPGCCEHDGSTHYLDDLWPTGEAIEVCDLCGSSRAHSDNLVSGWVYYADLDKERREYEKSLAELSAKRDDETTHVIRYLCQCGEETFVSVPRVTNDLQTRRCEHCGAWAVWQEFTV